MTIYCDKLKREVVVGKDNIHWSGNSQECETCGSHGSVTVYVSGCECGNSHDITVSEW